MSGGEIPVRGGDRPRVRHEVDGGIPEQLHARPHPADADAEDGFLDSAERRAGPVSENQHEEPQPAQPPPAAATAPMAPAAHVPLPDPRDRSGARALFFELRELPDGSPERAELRNRLVRMHLPLVEHLARRFRNRGEPLDDLTQVATIGLIKSVDRFDPDRGVEFSTYATPTVVGEIKRHFRDKGWAVRVRGAFRNCGSR